MWIHGWSVAEGSDWNRVFGAVADFLADRFSARRLVRTVSSGYLRRCVSALRAESAVASALDARRLRQAVNPSLTSPKIVRRF
jgi:hypothetical protein